MITRVVDPTYFVWAPDRITKITVGEIVKTDDGELVVAYHLYQFGGDVFGLECLRLNGSGESILITGHEDTLVMRCGVFLSMDGK